MMFLKESMYGWGVCNIPQPRASQDIFADRRKKSGAYFPADRRSTATWMGGGALWASFFRRDLPGLQVLAVLCFSLVMILGIWGGSLLIPEMTVEEEPPLEIMALLPEEPLPEPEPIVLETARPVSAPEPSPPKVARVPRPEIPQTLPPEPKITPPPKIVVEQPVKAEPVVLPAPRTVARQYRDAPPTKALLPAGKPADALALDRQTTMVQPRSSASTQRYAMTGQTTSTAGLPKRQAYAAGGGGTEVDLPDVAGLKRNFQLPRVSESRAAPAGGPSFVPASNSGAVAIRGAQAVGGNLSEVSRGNTGSVAMPGQADRSVGDRVGIAGGSEEVELPTITGVAGQGGAAAASSVAGAETGIEGGLVSFGDVGQGSIDQRIIDLNDLRACIDPGAEDPLKTALAVALDEDGSCALRDMVFYYRNPEDMYTLSVGVYNPEDFTDRCEALKAALECIHLKQ
jgi:hypothetical protein